MPDGPAPSPTDDAPPADVAQRRARREQVEASIAQDDRDEWRQGLFPDGRS